MPNKQRGEVEFKIKGKTYVIRPDFTALCEVEDKAGMGLTGLMFRFHENKAGVKEVTALLYGGLVSAGVRDFTFEDLGKAIMKAGFLKYMPIAAEFLRMALQSGDDDDSEGNARTGNDLPARERSVATKGATITTQ